MTSSHYAPYALGYTRATMGGTIKRSLRKKRLKKINPLLVRIVDCNSFT